MSAAGDQPDGSPPGEGRGWRLCLRLLLEFALVGATAFGGGSATIAAMRRTCLRCGWLDEEEFFETLLLSRLTPGTTIIAQIYLIGKRIAGYPGMVMAAIGLLVPSMTITLGLAKVYVLLVDSGSFAGPLAVVAAAAAGFALCLAVLVSVDSMKHSRWLRGAIWVLAYGGFNYLVNSPVVVILVALAAGALVPGWVGVAEAEERTDES